MLSETNQFPKLETSRLLGKNEQYKHNIYLKEEKKKKHKKKQSINLAWFVCTFSSSFTKFCAFVQGKKSYFLRNYFYVVK